MTITVFVVSLLSAIALGMSIAFALLVCGAALKWNLDPYDSQVLAQNMINGTDNFPLLALPFFFVAGKLMSVGRCSRKID